MSQLADYLRDGDLLVVNDTKVFPARLLGVRVPSGGAVECLLLANLDDEALRYRRGHRVLHRSRVLGRARPPRAEAAAWNADDVSRHAPRAAWRSAGSALPRPADDTSLDGERRERRGRDRGHRPHAAAAVYQARRHAERSRSVSDRVCARARLGRGAHRRTPFHPGAFRQPRKKRVSIARPSRCTSATAPSNR